MAWINLSARVNAPPIDLRSDKSGVEPTSETCLPLSLVYDQPGFFGKREFTEIILNCWVKVAVEIVMCFVCSCWLANWLNAVCYSNIGDTLIIPPPPPPEHVPLTLCTHSFWTTISGSQIMVCGIHIAVMLAKSPGSHHRYSSRHTWNRLSLWWSGTYKHGRGRYK